MTRRFTWSIALFSLLAAGCSGSDDDGGGGPGGTGSLQAFAGYCTGKTLRPIELMLPSGPGAWSTFGTADSVPAGTTFLVGASFDKWEGYVMAGDGTPMKLHADFQTGLIRDTDFSSPCATDDKLEWQAQHHVLLVDSTFYASQDLSGEACKLPVATELPSFGFISGGFGDGEAAQVSSDAIESTCGLTQSYSTDIVYGELVYE